MEATERAWTDTYHRLLSAGDDARTSFTPRSDVDANEVSPSNFHQFRRVVRSAGLRCSRARVQIAVATLSSNSLRQTVHTHRASVHQAEKLVAALLRVAGVTLGLAESNGSLPPGL